MLFKWTNVAFEVVTPHFLADGDRFGMLVECEKVICLARLHRNLDRLDFFFDYIRHSQEPGCIKLAASEWIYIVGRHVEAYLVLKVDQN